jgi:hypothetical protein
MFCRLKAVDGSTSGRVRSDDVIAYTMQMMTITTEEDGKMREQTLSCTRIFLAHVADSLISAESIDDFETALFRCMVEHNED